MYLHVKEHRNLFLTWAESGQRLLTCKALVHGQAGQAVAQNKRSYLLAQAPPSAAAELPREAPGTHWLPHYCISTLTLEGL